MKVKTKKSGNGKRTKYVCEYSGLIVPFFETKDGTLNENIATNLLFLQVSADGETVDHEGVVSNKRWFEAICGIAGEAWHKKGRQEIEEYKKENQDTPVITVILLADKGAMPPLKATKLWVDTLDLTKKHGSDWVSERYDEKMKDMLDGYTDVTRMMLEHTRG